MHIEIILPRDAAMLARSWDRNFVCPSVCCLSVCLSVTWVLCAIVELLVTSLLLIDNTCRNSHFDCRWWMSVSAFPVSSITSVYWCSVNICHARLISVSIFVHYYWVKLYRSEILIDDHIIECVHRRTVKLSSFSCQQQQHTRKFKRGMTLPTFRCLKLSWISEH